MSTTQILNPATSSFHSFRGDFTGVFSCKVSLLPSQNLVKSYVTNLTMRWDDSHLPLVPIQGGQKGRLHFYFCSVLLVLHFVISHPLESFLRYKLPVRRRFLRLRFTISRWNLNGYWSSRVQIFCHDVPEFLFFGKILATRFLNNFFDFVLALVL